MPPRRAQDHNYMAVDSDSDDSFIVEDGDGDFGADRTRGAKSKGKGKAVQKGKDKGKGKGKEQPYSWEASYTRSWDAVQEDEGGSLQTAVEDLLARGRRRRLLGPSTAIRRTIIRHLILILDLSASMLDKDMRPSRFDLTLEYARAFITEWFDQNPLGQIGIVGMRAGLGERVCDMSGNPQDVLKHISDRVKLEPNGEPSLQNAIEMARGSMSHLPSHSSREVLVIFGSLTSCDPGNIHDTLDACVKDRIRVSFVSLAAEMKICRDFCVKTGGTFGVALNEGHFKDLLFEGIPPPVQTGAAATAKTGPGNPAADLMQMGFPTRLPDTAPPALCVCHSELKTEGFLCPRCGAKLCDVPTDCDICGLMIVSSSHLARSYHHLFPVKPYEVFMDKSSLTITSPSVCHACALPFRESQQSKTPATAPAEGLSPLGRYRCPDCGNDFCADCDVFVHEVMHVCPSCHDPKPIPQPS
ncbi:TFIIH basal transcription factor complex, subunit SSL1 [Sistotremastrum niveocremeum HHB9708]|uniref:General transcription and DNA repair factor IIH n=1 Tax=Sistotremastrum niveocremeum HHB9708 TaxID=1314777 RepID=A0A164MPP6_9AGAM|nr:TFIIH basal transcription factor complex, subunit SSL1 [Sistotremastrum niveocremeum HHB9708]